jgi:hypothetical protein
MKVVTVISVTALVLAGCVQTPNPAVNAVYNGLGGAAVGAAIGCVVTAAMGCLPGAALGAAAGGGTGAVVGAVATPQVYMYPPTYVPPPAPNSSYPPPPVTPYTPNENYQ